MLTRLLSWAHAHAYAQARRRSSPLWWAAAIGTMLLARGEGKGERRESMRVKPGERVRVEVTRPPQ